MSDVYYEFFQTPEQQRRLGSRGGRATARNRHERLSMAATQSAPTPTDDCCDPQEETVAAAIALLDAQFPWLEGAEKRPSRR